MTTLWGDTGKAANGLLKSFSITAPTPRETLLGTPSTLPTTEPATAQVSFTVQTSDLPTITPNVPFKANASIVCSGKAGATASTISYRVLKNGVSQLTATAASTTAANFWTHTYWQGFDVQVGDVLEVKLWASTSDAYLDFYGLIVAPSQPEVSKRGTILRDLTFSTMLANTNAFSNTLAANIAQSVLYPCNTTLGSINVATNVPYLYVIPFPSFGLFRNSVGDAAGTTSIQNVAGSRTYQKVVYPLSFSFREVLR